MSRVWLNLISERALTSKGFRCSLRFHIADEKRRLQAKYELPLYRIVERLQFAIDEEAPQQHSDEAGD